MEKEQNNLPVEEAAKCQASWRMVSQAACFSLSMIIMVNYRCCLPCHHLVHHPFHLGSISSFPAQNSRQRLGTSCAKPAQWAVWRAELSMIKVWHRDEWSWAELRWVASIRTMKWIRNKSQTSEVKSITEGNKNVLRALLNPHFF